MLVPVVCLLLFSIGLVGAHALRQRGRGVPKWRLLAASSFAMLTLLLLRQG